MIDSSMAHQKRLQQRLAKKDKEIESLRQRVQELEEAIHIALKWLPEKRWHGGIENGFWVSSGEALLETREKLITLVGEEE